MSVSIVIGIAVVFANWISVSALHVPKHASNSSILTSGSYTTSGLEFNVVVPDGDGPFPVVILLHEKEKGSGSSAMTNFKKSFADALDKITETHVMVAAVGEDASWNIYAEPSHRDDAKLIGETLTQYLCKFSNVVPKFKLVGKSNGAALVNRILIENTDARIVSAVTCGSQLNEKQWHDGSFYIGGADNTYDTPAKHVLKRRILQITGKTDKTIPALGGETGTEGHLVFLSWDESAYHLAQAYGYVGEQRLTVTSAGYPLDDTEYVTYLDGQVQAYNIEGATHNDLLDADLIGPFLESL